MHLPHHNSKQGLRLLLLSPLLLTNLALADETEPTLYQPFSHAPLKKDLYVFGTLQGHCKKQSVTDTRNDAWQCRAFGKTYDPCFKHPYNKTNELICPKSPWSKRAIKMVTNDQLDNTNHQELDMSQAYPWAIELSDGTHCLSKPSTDPKQHDYKCQKKQMLSGRLMRCNTVWKISRVENNITDVASIKRAWF